MALLKIIPTKQDEFERAVEGGLGDAKRTIKGQVIQTRKGAVDQLKVTDQQIVDSLYGVVNDPSEKTDPQNPQEAMQVPQRTEEEDRGPKSNAEKYGTMADQIPVIPGQRESEYKPSTGSIEYQTPLLPGLTPPKADTSSIGEQLTGQSNAPDDMAKMAGIDPSKQMSAEDKAKLSDAQKDQREKIRLHERTHYNVSNKLETVGTLEEQVAKERQKRAQKEQQVKQEEEEQKKKKAEQKAQEKNNRPLQAPGKGAKGKKTNMMASDNERTKTERRSRGGGG